MGEKPQPALVTHFPQEPLCLRVQKMCLTVFSGPSSPVLLLRLAAAGPQSLACPCFFSSLTLRPGFPGVLVASSESLSRALHSSHLSQAVGQMS